MSVPASSAAGSGSGSTLLITAKLGAGGMLTIALLSALGGSIGTLVCGVPVAVATLLTCPASTSAWVKV